MPFKPGHSGNPAGRARAVQAITIIARKNCKHALALCVKAVADEKLGMTVRLVAAGMLLDRGLGRPAQQISAANLSDEELMAELVARREVRAKEEAKRADQQRDSSGSLNS